MIFDLHCDTLKELYARNREDLFSNTDMHISIERMSKGDVKLQCFALFDDMYLTNHDFSLYLKAADGVVGLLKKNSSHITLVVTGEDIKNNLYSENPMALLTMEDASSLGGSMDNFEQIYSMGFRIFGLSWNYDSLVGNGNFVENLRLIDENGVEYREKGLKPFGFDLVDYVNSAKGLIDVSHLSDKGFWDVVEQTKKPFVATHSNARALCDFPRNLTDDMLKAVGDKGGVCGLNFCGAFLDGSEDSKIEAIIAHMLHMVKKGGEDLVAFGADLDGIDSNLEIVDVSGMGLLVSSMEKAGMKPSLIDKITHKNALRILTETL